MTITFEPLTTHRIVVIGTTEELTALEAGLDLVTSGKHVPEKTPARQALLELWNRLDDWKDSLRS